MTKDEVREALKKAIGASTQAAFAKSAGVSPQYLNDVLQGYRSPGPVLLGAIGLEVVTTYRKKAAK